MKKSSKKEKARSPSRSGYTLPELARVPKPRIPDELLKKAPKIAAGAEVRTDARLRDMAERIRQGDDSGLRAKRLAGFGTTVSGLAGCQHYLPENRFDWWDVQESVPPTGPIKHSDECPDPTDAFQSEFMSPLATVVGTDLGLVRRGPLGRALAWDPLASPNNTPGIEFSVRTIRPRSVPIIRQVEVIVGPGERVQRKVLVNGVEEGHELDPTQTRPSLFIDFATPQRAVGLEYGFLGEDEREINANRIKLIARDRDGVVLGESSGGDLVLNAPIVGNTVYNLIGVRHQGGAISSVELTFEDPENPIPEPQIVYRIWHEALPPAAVRQGTVEKVWHGPGDDRNRDEEVSETLPFRCDQYMPMIRGFRLEHLDEPHEITGLSIEIEDRTGFRSSRPVKVSAGGSFGIRVRLPSEVPPYRLKIYYTLLAWDSDQVDLRFSNTVVARGASDTPDSSGSAEVDDPCESPWAGIFGSREEDCGPLFGALQSWNCHVAAGQYLEEVSFSLDYPQRTGVLGRRAFWGMGGTITGDDEGANGWRMHGRILTGQSLIAPSEVIGALVYADPLRRRSEREFWLDENVILNDGYAVPMEADMAFVELEKIILIPEGPVRTVDMEVKGHSFDGGLINWKMGFEGDSGPPDSYEGFFVTTFPRFGGLVRRVAQARPRLLAQDLRFEHAVVGILSLVPDQFGMIRNVGNIPVLITRAEKGGLHPGEFDIRLEYRNEVFSMYEVANRSPLELRVGEALIVGGRFFPQAEAGANDLPREAWIDFYTNAPRAPKVSLFARGHTVASQARGLASPSMINFGNVDVHASNRPSGFPLPPRNAIIESTGQTPLIIQSLALEDPNLGFGFSGGAQYQIEPGDSMIIHQIRFIPQDLGPVETKLIARTNAGELEIRLFGVGVG